MKEVATSKGVTMSALLVVGTLDRIGKRKDNDSRARDLIRGVRAFIQDTIKELRALSLSYRAIEDKTKWSRFTMGKVLKDEYDK